LLYVPAIAVLLLVAGCGAEPAGEGTSIGTTADPTPVLPPTTEEPEPTPSPADDDATIGEVLVSTTLAVEAGDYPGPPVPAFAEVSGADELASLFGVVPGIDDVVAAVEADPPTDSERLFVYVVAACRVNDVELELRGKKLTMVVHGNAALRCEPPPMQLVVWTVDAAEVPADAAPAQAVQK